MRILTRSEEYVLLTVWRLQDDAYSLQIRETISDITGHDWSLGSIYTPLERLEKRGLLTSKLSAETPERGGRKKRIYRLTNAGKRELVQIRTVGEAMWAGITGLVPEGALR
jgi:DNA-binding PadR family transcriptional regulator